MRPTVTGAKTREESKEEDAEDRAEVCVYSNGSGVDGLARAATVLFQDRQEVRSICYWLGPLMQHMTYEAEVVGVSLALEFIHWKGRFCMVSIKLDNHTVIQALGAHSTKPAQSLLNTVHDVCKEWMANDMQGH